MSAINRKNEWEPLINSLVSLDNKSGQISSSITNANTINAENIASLKIINNILETISKNSSSINDELQQIIIKLQDGKTTQAQTLNDLTTIANQSNTNANEIKDLLAKTNELSAEINTSSPSSGSSEEKRGGRKRKQNTINKHRKKGKNTRRKRKH